MSPRAKKLVKSNSDLLDGLGVLKKHKNDIALEQVYESVQNPPKTVPYAKRDAVYNELQRMMKLGVITSVKEPTERVNQMETLESAFILKIWIRLSDVSTTPWLLWKTSQRECRKRNFFQGLMLRVGIGK